ncbi:MAG: YbaB/EbfC family nucleoid-associated protein [Bacilli bacterium]
MNMQALMKQAQTLQKDMMNTKNEIDKMEFTGENSFVKVVVNGKKEVLSIAIDRNVKLDIDDLEVLEDILVVAINAALRKVEETTETKMGKFSNIPGLF